MFQLSNSYNSVKITVQGYSDENHMQVMRVTGSPSAATER